MKHLITLSLLSLLLFSCKNDNEFQYSITGEAKILKDGQQVFLEIENENGITVIDTAVVKEGVFIFEGTQTEPELHFISFKDLITKIPVIVESGKIGIEIKGDTLPNKMLTYENSVTKGTYNNDELYKFRNEGTRKIKLEMKAFERVNNQKMIEAQQSKDTVTINKLQKEYQGFVDRIENFNNTYIDKNPSSYVSVLLLEDMIYNPTSDLKKLTKQFNQLSAELRNTKKGKNILELLEKSTSVEVGNNAPLFEGPNPQGKTISLKESMGKYTLIEFWASWCPPCRKENPYTVAIYNEFHDKGLNIISVSLDKEAESWKKAIADDKLTWTHISNLQYWNEPIAKMYDVKSVPATFLLDDKGIILAKDLRQEDLHAKIKSLLK